MDSIFSDGFIEFFINRQIPIIHHFPAENISRQASTLPDGLKFSMSGVKVEKLKKFKYENYKCRIYQKRV